MEHNNGIYENSYSMSGKPWQVYLVIENLESRQAYLIEKHIKMMKSKTYIENLKKYPEMIKHLVLKYKDK